VLYTGFLKLGASVLATVRAESCPYLPFITPCVRLSYPGSILACDGKRGAAASLLQRAIRLAPTNVDAMCNYGAVLSEVASYVHACRPDVDHVFWFFCACIGAHCLGCSLFVARSDILVLT
jgi:hypothetical protein